MRVPNQHSPTNFLTCRSDMACSQDLADLKRQLEEKTSECAELLKQHESSLARCATFD